MTLLCFLNQPPDGDGGILLHFGLNWLLLHPIILSFTLEQLHACFPSNDVICFIAFYYFFVLPLCLDVDLKLPLLVEMQLESLLTRVIVLCHKALTEPDQNDMLPISNLL